MQIKPHGSNQTLAFANGCTVLYSYETPVALITSLGVAFRTDKRHSVTTSKHINKFLSDHETPVTLVPQDHLDDWGKYFGDDLLAVQLLHKQ